MPSTNLQYTAQVPKFLQGLHASLNPRRGDDGPTFHDPGDGRPPIPTRPDGVELDDGGDLDALGFERGEEAPQIVVVKEGKHLSRDELEADRKPKGEEDTAREAPATALGSHSKPSQPSSKGKASELSVPGTKASSHAGPRKRKAAIGQDGEGDGSKDANAIEPGKGERGGTKNRGKEDKEAKAKEKKKAKKPKVGLLSFSEEG